ncbi:MAG: hypothetical protein E7473_09445 [Ruminococcaceae bacterium]|nr:hypothetical protein [Oscillospiraceae bacterium]
MDIYEFFNSRDIAEHCKKINHQFTATEMAYIIWQSQYKTIKEKHVAWQYVIDELPDEELPKGKYLRKERSLHKMLAHLIKLEREYIDNFSECDGKYIFNYSIFRKGDDQCEPDDIFYDSYETCLSQLKDDIDSKTVFVGITKRRLYSSAPENEREIGTLHFNTEMEVLEIDDDTFFYKDWAQADGFMEMYFNIPTPFKPGDLVTCNSVFGERHPQFVLDYIPGQKKALYGKDMEWFINRSLSADGDLTYMMTSMYDTTDDGDIFWSHGANYMYLEYPREEPNGKEKFLFMLSNYLKNEISLEEFLNARDILRAEKNIDELSVNFADNRQRYLCGLMSKQRFEYLEDRKASGDLLENIKNTRSKD